MATVSFQNPLKFYKEIAQKDMHGYEINFTVEDEKVRGGGTQNIFSCLHLQTNVCWL